jgi:N-acetylmuramoyl-L-alanine amidase
VRRGVLLAVALLASAASDTAAQSDAGVNATPADGAAPLQVTFTAPSPVRWNFGDGTFGSGQTVVHTFAAGRWTATWASDSGSGSIPVTARGIDFMAPARVRYRRRVTFRGRLIPAESGVGVQIAGGGATFGATTKADGSFSARVRVARGGTWTAATSVATASANVAVIPQLLTGLLGSGARGSRFVFAASVVPRDAGRLTVTIQQAGQTLLDETFAGQVRIRLDSRRLTTYVIRARLEPSEGFTPVLHVLRAEVVLPRLSFGASGPAVAGLASRLRSLHYATPFTARFDDRLLESVYAFEKVQELARTGLVGPLFWRSLANPRIPTPRYPSPADHIEIDKAHQVLYVVRGSQIDLIVPVSTAGLPGRFTPAGRFSIYRKVSGFDPSPLGTLFDPMYFTGGYAIHGNPSVPPYPASHGCVRVPMWIAPYLYATNPYGETVYVY